MALRPRPAPLTHAQRIAERRAGRKGVVVAQGVPADREVENWYTRQLLAYLKRMHDDIDDTLNKQLVKEEPLYMDDGSKATLDSFVDNFGRTLEALRKRWSVTDFAAKALSSAFVGKMNDKTKKKLEKAFGKAMGVDIANMVASEGLATAIDASIRENVRLIKSIPEEYLDKIQRIVDAETIKGRSGRSIIEQIQEVYPVTQNKARLIARDQSNKVNGDLTRERQVSTGIRGYRWRTVGDDSVRKTHRERNGKVYAWNPADVGKKLDSGETMLNPEADGIGHPGEDIQCRCIAEPILELDRII